ncbi:MAG: transposase [Candidatus Niyogibacteria bacterium]|nr:transposase [Candidatus Niyogibacteria bacterium]
MPNHFHMMMRQLQENGVSIFLQRLQMSHSKYFNKVYKRVGVLFGGRFKAVHIGDDEQFTHVSRYIHLNPLELFDPQWKGRGYVVDKEEAMKFLKAYTWSSMPDYLGNITQFSSLIDKKPIMEYFDNNPAQYLTFLQDWIASEQSSDSFMDFDLITG